MRIVILSDIHDNLINLGRCLTWCNENNIEEIICCGDVTNSETLKFLASKFKGSIYLVKGNVEIYSEQEIKKYNNIIYFGKIGNFKIDNIKIGICHEPYLFDKVLKKECNIVFYGHTHKPWEETRNKIRYINSGTLGGMFSKGTFAILDTKTGKIELKILELLN